MPEIAPSLLAADVLDLGGEIRRMTEDGLNRLHLDIMDGHFVPNLSFGPDFCRAIHTAYPGIRLDVHLMTERPELYIDTFAGYGASSITVHLETVSDPSGILKSIHEKGLQAGLSVKPATPAEKLVPWLDDTDMVLIMTVEPGFGGQALMPDQIEKIRFLRDAGYTGLIAADGGVNADNARMIGEAGADIVIMGTSYFRAEDRSEVLRAVYGK